MLGFPMRHRDFVEAQVLQIGEGTSQWDIGSPSVRG